MIITNKLRHDGRFAALWVTNRTTQKDINNYFKAAYGFNYANTERYAVERLIRMDKRNNKITVIRPSDEEILSGKPYFRPINGSIWTPDDRVIPTTHRQTLETLELPCILIGVTFTRRGQRPAIYYAVQAAGDFDRYALNFEMTPETSLPCNDCGVAPATHTDNYGAYYCDDCMQGRYICADCGRILEAADAFMRLIDNKIYCSTHIY